MEFSPKSKPRKKKIRQQKDCKKQDSTDIHVQKVSTSKVNQNQEKVRDTGVGPPVSRN